MRRAVIADDHPLLCEAVSVALHAVSPGIGVTCAGTLADAESALAQPADLLVLDLGLPDVSGLSGLALMRGQWPEMPVLVFSAQDRPEVQKMVQAMGAVGFLSKKAQIPVLAEALRTVLDGGKWFDESLDGVDAEALTARIERFSSLTPAQMRVLEAMKGGRLNKQIAYDLGIAEVTVKAHIKQILRKLDVGNRTQAVLEAREIGRLTADPQSEPDADPKG